MDMASALASLPTATMSLSLAPVREMAYFENAGIFHSTLNFYNVAQLHAYDQSVCASSCLCVQKKTSSSWRISFLLSLPYVCIYHRHPKAR